ncbi:hypothetical protein GGX14DRAFT_399359 [Mycena pura]|uniref:Uncharacterized protein n=1 Tax=Mycena pura TaxID=153505 RepID=A0AAD6Y6X2_9AGAR|nr:hypothetical protein GGX14DRAFT_399359 [Mycena pura]
MVLVYQVGAAVIDCPERCGLKDFRRISHVRQIRTNCRDFFLHIEDVYRAGLPTLDIEAYVDLNAPALAARFAPDQGKSTPAESLPIAAKRTGTTTKWTDEDTEWDAASW